MGTQTEFSNGAKYARDNIICTLLGLQNSYKYESEGYNALNALLSVIEDKYGKLMKDFKG